MSEETGLVKRESGSSFIERLVENADTLEQIKEVGMVIIKSGFCPEHFKQSQDAVGAIMCIEAGRKIGLSWMQSLSDIYPVKGRIGIMGTAAKAVIFSSGVLESWEEFTEGEYPNPDYKHITISKRKDLPKIFRTEFSVYDAQVAGLMQKDIYKKYGKRMIAWRDIGFHASDYYQDILKGMKTVEELNDFEPLVPGADKVTIQTADGKEIVIPNKEVAEERSKKVTARAIDKIEAKNFAPVTPPPNPPIRTQTEVKPATIVSGGPAASVNDDLAQTESPFKPERGSVEMFDGKITKIDGKELSPEAQEERKDAGEWTIEAMSKMDTELLVEKINTKSEMIEAMVAIPGKNTNKKLREIIDAWQRGRLDMLTAPFKGRDIVDITAEQGIQDQQKEAENESAPAMNQGIQPNRDFDKQTREPELELEKPLTNELNKYGLQVPEFDKGNEREFSTTKRLYNDLLTVNPKIDNERWLELKLSVPSAEKYKNKEEFLKYATVKEICDLLNAN